MAKKAFDQGRLFGVTHGSPPFAVLALPGWMHQATDWDEALSILARDPERPVGSVALDLPGFGGATPEPDTAMGSAGYAELVAPVLDELATANGEGALVVAGHSFGGRVALHLAAARPDRVQGLVITGVPKLVKPTTPPARPAASYRLARWLNRWGVLSDERMEQRRRSSGSADYRNAPSVTMRNVLVAVTNEDYEEQLDTIRCPVELVWGADDTAAPLDTARGAVERLGADRATLTVLDGVDHFTPTRAPDALAGAIRRALQTTDHPTA